MVQKKKKGVIYCRVSTSKQKTEGVSLESQEKSCRDYCKINNIQVIGVYKEAFTGKDKNRQIFNEAINNSKENNVNYFIIFDIDRFSREGYGVYEELKKDLYKSGIELKDSKNVIGENTIVMKNDLVDMSQYKWNIENNSEYAEVMISTQAKIEGKKIMQRTITREIELEQMGYKVRQANFGYENLKITTNFGKATIQIKHTIEGEWMQELFTKRAEGNLTDEEIVNDLNNKGYKSRRGVKLNVKQLQVYIKSTVYAGVIITKWTSNKPVRTPYKPLIDIKTWNLANKGKIKIIEIDSSEVKIEYNNNDKSEVQTNQPIIKNRLSYNPFYCYAKVLQCPICMGVLTGSTSRGRNKKQHHYYFCKGKGTKENSHKSYSLKRDDIHNNLTRTFRSLKVDNNLLELYDDIIKEVYNDRIKEISSEKGDYKKYLKILYDKKKDIIRNIDKVIDYPDLLEAKNEELENIKLDIAKTIEKSDESENLMSLEKDQYYSKQIIKHLDKLIIQEERPDLINIAFEIIYGGPIEYEKIISQTTILPGLASNLSHKKNPQSENSSGNLKWQP